MADNVIGDFIAKRYLKKTDEELTANECLRLYYYFEKELKKVQRRVSELDRDPYKSKKLKYVEIWQRKEAETERAKLKYYKLFYTKLSEHKRERNR